jgi:hypothetical protein
LKKGVVSNFNFWYMELIVDNYVLHW